MRIFIVFLFLSTSTYANNLDCDMRLRTSYNHYDTFGVPFIYDREQNSTSRLIDYYQFQNLNYDFDINLKLSEKENEYIIFEGFEQLEEINSKLYPLLTLSNEETIIFHLVKNKLIKYKEEGGLWESEDILKQLKDENFTFEKFDEIVKSNYAKDYKVDIIELENTGRALKFFFEKYKVSINKGVSDSYLLSVIDRYRSLTDSQLNEQRLHDDLVAFKKYDANVFWEYYDQEVDSLRCYNDDYKKTNEMLGISEKYGLSNFKYQDRLCLGEIEDILNDPLFSDYDNINFDEYKKFVVIGLNISYDHGVNETNFLTIKHNAHTNATIVGLCN